MKAVCRLSLILAGSVLLASARLSAQVPQQPAQTAMELLEKATEAKAVGDHAGALVFYNQTADLLAEDPSGKDGMGLVVRADLQRDIARASNAAGTGDPCAALAKGKAYLDQARRTPSAEGDMNVGPIVDDMEQQLEREGRRMRCVQPAPPIDIGKPDGALAGHYYLSGVMETGSELLLKADGRFEWYISYGAVDQVAKGRWGRADQTVILAADLPAADAPLFRVDQAFPWDEAAERRLRDATRARAAEAIAERCPWTIGVAASPPLLLPEDRPAPGLAERTRAAEARRIAETARDDASRATAKGAAAGASEADRTAAEAAMVTWYEAQYEMEQAYRAADVPLPDIGAPVVPGECQAVPDDASANAPIPSSQWRRGVAVVVGDPAREMRLSRVGVTFVFNDGHRETAETSRGGWAFLSRRNGAAVEQLVLTLPDGSGRSASLPIPPLTEGVQTVAVDTQQLVALPFDLMRLQVQGRDLIPENMGRGRYSRN
ncbi:hypothetical protein [Novosphingobium sp.]|uniref:hypothetical protein n=1 Tax=Novosphingobium sp. TaxID=1874826 RepID=UPI0035ADA7EF